MIDYAPFFERLRQEEALLGWAEALPSRIEKGLSETRYGDLPRWKQALAALPDMSSCEALLDQDTLQVLSTDDSPDEHALTEALQGLHPWRKGPFQFFDCYIDTEWRSDWKWQRVQPHLSSLDGRKVLDIGCGSGYHCWRMRAAGADLVIGIDPTPLFICQFFALQKYVQDPNISVLPMGIEHLPEKLRFFDTVFSMGILYHRRSPFDHLLQLRDLLRPGGELVLETLIIDGGPGDTLVPEGRYGKMGNVWFLPSADTLISWLHKAGFKNPRCVDINQTSLEEQRSTEWMRFQSLADFLDPEDRSRTVEGHPAPIRGVFIAEAP